jgi:hypothetical protein
LPTVSKNSLHLILLSLSPLNLLGPTLPPPQSHFVANMRVISLVLPAAVIAATSAQAAVITTERYNNGSVILVDLPQQNLAARAADTGLQNRWNTILKQVGADGIKSLCNTVLPSVSTTQTSK